MSYQRRSSRGGRQDRSWAARCSSQQCAKSSRTTASLSLHPPLLLLPADEPPLALGQWLESKGLVSWAPRGGLKIGPSGGGGMGSSGGCASWVVNKHLPSPTPPSDLAGRHAQLQSAACCLLILPQVTDCASSQTAPALPLYPAQMTRGRRCGAKTAGGAAARSGGWPPLGRASWPTRPTAPPQHPPAAPWASGRGRSMRHPTCPATPTGSSGWPASWRRLMPWRRQRRPAAAMKAAARPQLRRQRAAARPAAARGLRRWGPSTPPSSRSSTGCWTRARTAGAPVFCARPHSTAWECRAAQAFAAVWMTWECGTVL